MSKQKKTNKTVCNPVLFIHTPCILCVFRRTVLLGDFASPQSHFNVIPLLGASAVFNHPRRLHWFPVPKYLNNMFPCLSDPARPAKLPTTGGFSSLLPPPHLPLPVALAKKGLVRSCEVVGTKALCHFPSPFTSGMYYQPRCQRMTGPADLGSDSSCRWPLSTVGTCLS